MRDPRYLNEFPDITNTFPIFEDSDIYEPEEFPISTYR